MVMFTQNNKTSDRMKMALALLGQQAPVRHWSDGALNGIKSIAGAMLYNADVKKKLSDREKIREAFGVMQPKTVAQQATGYDGLKGWTAGNGKTETIPGDMNKGISMLADAGEEELAMGLQLQERQRQLDAEQADSIYKRYRADNLEDYNRRRTDSLADKTSDREYEEGLYDERRGDELEDAISLKNSPGWVKPTIPVPGRDVPFSDDVQTQKMDIAAAGKPVWGSPQQTVPVSAGDDYLAGVPDAPVNPFININDPKEREKMKAAVGKSIMADFAKTDDDARLATETINDLDRFVELMDADGGTGGAYRLPLGLGDVVAAFDEEGSQMKAISDKLTPRMRQGMPGAASDRDVAMFRGSTVSLDKPTEANRKIAMGFKVANQNLLDRREFRQAYFGKNGHVQGADALWKRYLEANPIFKNNKYEMNDKRKTWREFFSVPETSPVVPTGQQPAPVGSVPQGLSPEAEELFKKLQ